MSLGLVSPLLNRGVRSRWLASLPGAGTTKMLTIDSNGDTAFQDIPTAAWGSIAGTLSSQTDLQNALNAKLSLTGGTLTGAILIPTGTAGAPSIAFTDDTDAGIYRQANAINFSIGGTLRQQFQGDGSIVLSGTDPYLIIGTSLALSRDGNDILAQKRATAAQTFRVYNTYTDASNYERAKIAWESNVLRIGTEKAGTGSARAVEIQTDGTTRLTIGATGTLTLTGIGSAGTSTLRVNAGSGSSFTQINDNGTVVIDSDTATGTFPLTLKYAGTTVASVSYQGTITGGIGAFSSLSLDSGFVILDTDAVNTLAQRNSTNAQTFRVYNTYTDASNYERGQLAWESNEFRIGATAAGTGTQRSSVLGVWTSAGVWHPSVVVGNRSIGDPNLWVTGSGGMIRMNRTGLVDMTLGEVNGDSFAIRNNGDSSVMFAVNATTKAATTYGQLTNALGTITASTPLTLTQTWNNAAVTFTGALVNVTDTASNASSLLMDLQVGGSSRVSVSKSGVISVPAGSGAAPSIKVGAQQSGLYAATNQLHFVCDGASRAMVDRNSVLNIQYAEIVNNDSYIGFSNSSAYLYSEGNASNAIGQRRTTNAQTFRVYNTFTDASNYERGKIEWSSNVLRIGTEKAGTGSARALELQTDGTTRLTIGATGDVTIATPVTLAIPSGTGNALKMQTTDNSTNVVIALQDSSSNQLRACAFNFLNSAGTAQGQIAFWNSSTAANQYMNFNVAATEILRLTNATATLSVDLTLSTKNIVTDTTTGTKIGTATTQKIGFYNKTPVVQPAAVADATDAASVIAQLNLLLSRMRDLGIIAT